MERENFDYYAFISYSHRDQETAKKLHKRLQSYHLPSKVLQSNPDVPKKLSPVFLDENNLVGPGPLGDNLKKYLDSSKYLIVICSPNSAQSVYVNDEVKYFISKGRLDRIIPLIIDGEPHAKDLSEECFPPALLSLGHDDELLGIDFRKKYSFLRVIATLLGLKIEEFVDGEIIRIRKKMAMFASMAAAIMVAAGFLVWHNIPHTHYYHSYVYKWEKPIGLFEVESETDRKKMEYTYKFTTLRGKVQSIERVNSAGILVDPYQSTPFLEPPMIVFVSDIVVEYYNQYRHRLYRKQYTENMQAVDFYSGGKGDYAYTLPSNAYGDYKSDSYDPELSNWQESGSISRLTLEYDENGYVIKQTFRRDNRGGRDKKGTPAQDAKGRWGMAYKRDELGRVIEAHYLDRNGEAMSVLGAYAEHYEYGKIPYPVKTAYVGKNGELVLGPRGYAFDMASFDEYFNITEWHCYGTDGVFALDEEHKVSGVVVAHDPETGFLISGSYYGTDLAPCVHKDGNSRVDIEYNTEGRPVKVSYYDVNGKKTVCSNGYAEQLLTYNDEGRVESIALFDTEGRPTVATSDNTYGLKFSYEDGFMTRIDNVDAEGNLMLNKYGSASAIRTYDKDENKLTGFTFKDTDGHNVMTSWGYAEVRYTYDADGNNDSETNYDENGKPIPDMYGVAEWRYVWKDGNIVSKKCFDAEGKLTLNSYSYASGELEYDENGLIICERYYDTNGKRVMLPDWKCSALRYAYNSRGQKISESYYDTEDKPAVRSDEYYCYAKNYEYDDAGNLIHVEYVRDTNSPYQAMLDNQVKHIYLEYDKYGREIKKYWLNGKGEEVDYTSNPRGDVRNEKEFDIYGRQSKLSFYRRGKEKAYSGQTYEYDSYGREMSLYSVRYDDMREIIIKKEYDDYGNCCKLYYLDGKNKLMIPNNNSFSVADFAVKKSRYDIFGHETDVWYYDENEKPLSSDERAFHTVKTFDVKGNILTESYYSSEDDSKPAEGYDSGSNGDMLKIAGKLHKVERRYNASGHAIERYAYSLDGNLIRKVATDYNSLGKMASASAYGSDGKPLFNKVWGAFKIAYAYDSYGNMSDIWYFDADGKPCQRIGEKGAREHHRKWSYDVTGNLLSFAVFDTEEKPCSLGEFHKIVNVYDAYGLRSEEIYYDEGQNVLGRKLFKYDSNGKQIESKWVD